MDRATQERLTGAVILVLAVIAIVPAVLTGRPDAADPPAARESELRTLEIELAPAPRPAETIAPEPVPAADPQAGVRRAPRGIPADDVPAAGPPAAAAPREAAPSSSSGGAPPASAPPPPAAPPAAAPGSAMAGAWAVQLGAFSSQASAEKLVTELRRRGYPAFLLEYRADGRVLHRVRVGPEQDRARADALAARLAGDGYRGNVAPHP